MKHSDLRRLGALLLLAVLLLAWEVPCRALRVPALVLPPPSAIALALWKGLASGYFWPHLRATALDCCSASQRAARSDSRPAWRWRKTPSRAAC